MTDPKLIEAVARAYAKIADGANYDAMPPESREMYAKRVMPIISAYEAARGDGVCDPAEFEVRQEGMMVAGASGSRDRALNEARHYAAVYGQDGPVEVVEVVPLDLRTGRAMIAAAKGE